MAVPHQEDVDSLASLEERINRTVELVAALRRENQELIRRLESLEAERERADADTRAATEQVEKLTHEVEELRSERKQVRTRIEKLLGQMDLLTTS